MAAEVERVPSSFEFMCDGAVWKGIPVVNGHQLLHVTSADVHLDASSVPVVTLKLWASDAVKLGLTGADVMLDGETREALISLGWTPPRDGEACYCGSRHPDGYVCRAGTTIEPELNLAGATVTGVICQHCKTLVPVECGDVTGMDLDGMIAAAQQGAALQHPDHGTVKVGAFESSDA